MSWIVLLAGILLGILATPSPAAGQKPSASTIPSMSLYSADRHYGIAIDRQLWLDPWAHGYQHGYEDGFHRGEWAHQMFEHPGSIKKQTDWKRADRGYQPVMGDRQEFQQGYRDGFEAGFEEAYSGRTFDALAGLQRHNPSFACGAGCQTPLVASRPPAPH